MSMKTIRASEEYHTYLKSHNREGETIEGTLKRLSRGPDPDEIAGILSEESADKMEAAIENLSDRREGYHRA